MKIRNRVLAAAGAAMLLTSASLGTFAAVPINQADVDVKILPISGGTVTVAIAETTPFTDVTYNVSTAQTSTGSLTVTTTDDRGTGLGWNVTIGATDFARQIHTTVGHDITINNLTLTAGAPTRSSGVGTIPTATTSQTPVTTPQSQLWNAATNEGDGQFKLPLNGSLNVPAGTLVDTYKSTVTVNVTFAP
jgi:hypothetical protein